MPARALLQMVERAVAAMQPATAAAHADSLFGFLQQALDVRQRGDVSAADADAVERAATATLVAATMKLSEKQFKPLFLRLLAWASTPPAGQPGTLSCMPHAFSSSLPRPGSCSAELQHPHRCGCSKYCIRVSSWCSFHGSLPSRLKNISLRFGLCLAQMCSHWAGRLCCTV